MAISTSSCVATASTPASFVYSNGIASRNTSTTEAASNANSSDEPMATVPATRARTRSPAPTLKPTRMVAAMPSDIGIMYVMPPTFDAIWCAATESTPRRPMSNVISEKIAISKNIVAPIGRPETDETQDRARIGPARAR